MTIAENEYTLDFHAHKFACWTAARAASVRKKDKGIKVQEAVKHLIDLSHLTDPTSFPWSEDGYREWHNRFCDSLSTKMDRSFGQVAKLVAIYMKTRFVCGSWAHDDLVACIYPPIDALLLKELKNKTKFRLPELSSPSWSSWSKTDHAKVMKALEEYFPNRPLWQIEYFWPVYRD